MENTDQAQPTKAQKMQQEATRILGGDDEFSQQLVEHAKAATKLFANEFSELLKKHIERMKEENEAMVSSVSDKDTRDSLIGLVVSNVIEELISIMLTASSQCAVTAGVKMSSFIYRAAEMFEHAVMDRAMSSITEKFMEFMMRSRPEPDKENLS